MSDPRMRPPGAGGRPSDGSLPDDYQPPGDGTETSTPPGYGPPGYGPQGYGPGGGRAAAPAKPKTLREKAIDAFKAGQQEQAFDLLVAHYLTVPEAGTELARNMQWCATLRRPTLAPRFGVAVIYGTPHNFDGNPQPVGSPELDAALSELENANRPGEGQRGGANSRRLGAGRKKNREGGANRPPMGGPPGGMAAMPGSGMPGGGQMDLNETPREELEFYTGELGTKLLSKLKTKMETSAFGLVLKEANKAVPFVVKENNANVPGAMAGGVPMAPPQMRAMGPPGDSGDGGESGMYGPPGAEGNNADRAAALSTQLIPGVTWLGAVENVKELSEVIVTLPVDVVFIFDVKVRPASASNWVNNDTRLRVASAAKVTEAIFTSSSINNKGVVEARKKKNGEDLVNEETTKAIAAVEQACKLEPLPAAVTADVALRRVQALAAAKPDSALPLLLEARFYVAKKLLKPEEMLTIVMAEVSEDQLGDFSRVLGGEDVKEKIAQALQGPGGEKPKTVLGKFGGALLGAGGLGGLVPTPELPPIALPGSLTGGSAQRGGPVPGGGPGRPGAGGPNSSTDSSGFNSSTETSSSTESSSTDSSGFNSSTEPSSTEGNSSIPQP
jgi:hypothetical protein